ncbi:PD40 domain-containing protein [Eudoraea adriatica]|uniref:PD40 domain-containing protein n=1 Tax=Eudoraea adriatica TaxID=446681 RepID=UPI00036B0E16|nr:PD40 domain-containing protein [Eudoraea adriatica]
MKSTLTYKVALGCLLTFFCYSSYSQNPKISKSVNPEIYEANKRASNYQELLNLGYAENEIYEDLGNANFLSQNYETAVFWYKKLIAISEDGILNSGCSERYQFALQKVSGSVIAGTIHDKDWLAQIKSEYHVNNSIADRGIPVEELPNPVSESLEDLAQKVFEGENDAVVLNDKTFNYKNAYKTPISVTADGNTAYFSKASFIQPKYGVFSKKQLVHKIYRAEKVNGRWKNIKEVALSPKYYSSMHPTVSKDGKRLFFASDMPGTFGKYDIYVSAINKDGSMGVAKNLGEKVNTKKNDLYPNLAGGTTLFYASDGHKGHGGLDVFMVQVFHKKVGWSVNLGSPINSNKDDFSISLTGNGTGYVMSNRGNTEDAVQQVAFQFLKPKNDKQHDDGEYNFAEVFSTEVKANFASSVYEDD